jgi:hypothetical protein
MKGRESQDFQDTSWSGLRVSSKSIKIGTEYLFWPMLGTLAKPGQLLGSS